LSSFTSLSSNTRKTLFILISSQISVSSSQNLILENDSSLGPTLCSATNLIYILSSSFHHNSLKFSLRCSTKVNPWTIRKTIHKWDNATEYYQIYASSSIFYFPSLFTLFPIFFNISLQITFHLFKITCTYFTFSLPKIFMYHHSLGWNYLRHQKKFLAEGFIYLYIFFHIQAPFKLSFRDKRNI